MGLSLVAAGWDIRTRRIPNWLCAAIAVAAIAASYFTAGVEMLGLSALHALAALVVGMALFAAGFIGAGDAKMYSSIAFAIGLGDALGMLGWTSVAGLFLLVSMALARRVSGKPLRKDGKSFAVPYGVAISAGFILTVML